jgi:hypothetical protein
MISKPQQGGDPSSHPMIGKAPVASKSRYVFITPDEFLSLMDELVRSVPAQAVILSGPGESRVVWQGSPEDVFGARRLHVAPAGPLGDNALSVDANTAELGWVSCDVPRFEGSALLGVQVAARSDWYNRVTKTVEENRHSLKWFGKVWKVFATHLQSPVRARNVVSGAEETYSSIYYSSGAARWYREGGHLRQDGVANVEFLIP